MSSVQRPEIRATVRPRTTDLKEGIVGVDLSHVNSLE
jgi:hypothetical protein